MIETLKTGQARNIFPPEKQDAMIERQIRSEENAWLERQLADLEAEGIDAGAIRASSEEVSARILEEAKAKGDFTSEDAAAELNDFSTPYRRTTSPLQKANLLTPIILECRQRRRLTSATPKQK